MSTIPAPDHFREQLSAWHDGALSAEASRFVLKRLLADEDLRAELGRWQAVGDALRRQRIDTIDAGMAGRVATVIAAETAAMAAAAGSAAPPRRAAASGPRLGRWAIAAVVGMAAVLLLPGDETPADATAMAALNRVAPVPIEVPIRPIVRSEPLPPLRRVDFDAAALIASVPLLARAPQPTPEQLAPLPATEVPSRPWPRSSGAMEPFSVDYVPSSDPAAPRP